MRSLDLYVGLVVVILLASGFTIFVVNRLPRLATPPPSANIAPTLTFDIENVAIASDAKSIKFGVTYSAETNNTDTLQMLLFVHKSFLETNRPIYMFYDSQLMTSEAIQRADTIIRYFNAYNITINTVSYKALETLAKQMAEILLIIIDPLKDREGRRLENALPAPLIDSNKNGYIRDDSKYGKSILYDWMKDEGLILVTAGSLQPHKKILYGDGVYTYTKDSTIPFDTHEYLTEASGNKSIIKGGFTLGNYTSSRISAGLGLEYRETPYGFDEDAVRGYGLQFYSYGNYKLQGSNLSLPVFIRVGKGGWLAMDDSEYWLSDRTLAHDFFMIYEHAVWDSEWIPLGWYDDSGTTYSRYKQVETTTLSGNIATEAIPIAEAADKVILRVLGIAYSNQQQEGALTERILVETP